MAGTVKLTICHLYPDLMDTYGDWGNIQTFIQRCKWRNIDVEVVNSSLNKKLNQSCDIYFFGGGQDKTQEIVSKDLLKNKKDLVKIADDEAVILAICGGFQLLLNYFKTSEEKTLKGLGIFKGYTQGSETRMIGNLQIELSATLKTQISNIYKPQTPNNILISNLIGYENHSGKTYLEEETQPLGKVIFGNGNNGEDKTEGAIYKNTIGCYLHGSLLPKNPHFADFLISKALVRKYGKCNLEPLDDSLEWQAHQSAAKRIRSIP